MSEAPMDAETMRNRLERLGITQQELADKAKVSRGAVHRVLAGENVRGSTVSAIERALAELGGEAPDRAPIVVTIYLPDGRRVVFEGDPDGVAEAARRLVDEPG